MQDLESTHTKTIDDLTLNIYRDEYPEDPRKEFDHIGKMVCFANRYALGDENPRCTPQEWLAELAMELHEKFTGRTFQGYADDIPTERAMATIEKYAVIIPVYAYIHSGITINTGSFSCPWDSGQIGWIYADNKAIDRECNGDRDECKKCLDGEIAEYDKYLTGDVYRYEILDKELNFLDSCGGFYGEQYAIEEGESALKSLAADVSRYQGAGI
jgi:hypothetical protein